jgi:hypothetical protein
MCLQDMIYKNLSGENNEQFFGPQTVIDEWDHVVGTNHRLLLGATTLTVEQVVETIHRRAGLAIASHVDRERFSLIGQLGFIPKGLGLDALEVSASSAIKQGYDYPVVTFSDAHFLEDIGKSHTNFMIMTEDMPVDEIKKALQNEMGRKHFFN